MIAFLFFRTSNRAVSNGGRHAERAQRKQSRIKRSLQDPNEMPASAILYAPYYTRTLSHGCRSDPDWGIVRSRFAQSIRLRSGSDGGGIPPLERSNRMIRYSTQVTAGDCAMGRICALQDAGASHRRAPGRSLAPAEPPILRAPVGTKRPRRRQSVSSPTGPARLYHRLDGVESDYDGYTCHVDTAQPGAGVY